ncbi:MAG: sodium/solute symporter [Pseudomonadota bacterium]
MAEFGALNWAIVLAYLFGNLGLGWLMSRRVKSSDDYYLGDRSAPWWAIGISVIATYVSALSFLGAPAWAYGDGMAALAIHINYPLVIIVVIAVFLPFFYNSGVASIYEYLERRFGKTSRLVMSALFLVTQAITTASILTATAIVISFVTGLPTLHAIGIITVIVLIYTLLGGMNAVIWTDVLQGIILFIGATVVFAKLLDATAPFSGALSQLADADKLDPLRTELDFSVAPTVWAGVFAMTLFHITVYGGNQMMVQRALAAKSIGDAKKSYLMMGYGAFFIYFFFFFIGALLYVHFDGKPFAQTNEIILVFAENLAIPGLMGIITAAVMSASMSTMSSALNSLSTVSVIDFYRRLFKQNASEVHYLFASRVFTLIWALSIIPIALAFLSSGGSILETLTAVGSYLVGSKLAMFGLGFFSKHTTERGLLIGVVAGFLALFIVVQGIPGTGIGPANIAWPWYVVIGGGVNILVGWGASLLLDGKQLNWHPETIPGQRAAFEAGHRPIIGEDGWYFLPGRVEKAAWPLIGFFALTIAALAWFGTLG